MQVLETQGRFPDATADDILRPGSKLYFLVNGH
jgi:hypothetical protein